MSIEVSGGSAGTSVRIDEVDAAGVRLTGLAERALGLSLRVGRVAADPGLLLSAPLSPATAARVELALAGACGPAGLGGDAAGLAELAAGVRGVVAAYRAGEAAVTGGVEAAQDLLMFGAAPAVRTSAAVALAADRAGLPPWAALDELAYRCPGLIDISAGGFEGLLTGLAVDDPLVAPLLLVGAWRAGRAFPPRSYEDGLATLAGTGELGGFFRDGAAARVELQRQPPEAMAPRDLEDLLSSQVALESGEPRPGQVRVVQVPQRGGGSAWVVQVSGTQVWSPTAGVNPSDLTTNLRLMARQQTVLAGAVEEALERSMAQAHPQAQPHRVGEDPSDDPVMLVGHSQGGIAAAALASSAAFRSRHRVTHVVTAGAPVARFPVPSSVSVLALEHRQDPVPRLDGAPSPDRASWVTVRRDVPVGAGRPSAVAVHSAREYARTAGEADRSDAPSLRSWRAGSGRFFAGNSFGQPRVWDYRVERRPAPSVAGSSP